MNHMKRAILNKSRSNYENKLKFWNEYRATLGSNDPGKYLERLKGRENRVARILHFHHWMYENKGQRRDSITITNTAIRDSIRSQGKYKYDWLTDVRIEESTKKSCAMSNEELRIHKLKQKENTKLPYPLESLQGAREKYWVNSPPGSAGLSQRVLWIALAIAVQDGKRLSNLVLPAPGAQDHTARRTDMKFWLTVAGGGKWVNTNQLKEALITASPEDFMMAVLTYPTDKTSRQTGGNAPDELHWGRSTPLESQALSDIITFLAEAYPDPSICEPTEASYLLSRYHNGKIKTPTRKDVVDGAIKDSVSTSGIDPKYFSGKSCRSGLASHANAEGVSMAEIKHRGGWAKKSSVPANYYIRSTANSRGALAIGNEDLSKNSINIAQTKIVVQGLSMKD